MGRHTFDSYFWVFQMSTILHAFGVQLWNLAALLHALSRHICIRSMDAHVSFYHWFLSFFSIAGPVVSCGNSRPCGERVDRTQRQVYCKHLNWLWHSQMIIKEKAKKCIGVLFVGEPAEGGGVTPLKVRDWSIVSYFQFYSISLFGQLLLCIKHGWIITGE